MSSKPKINIDKALRELEISQRYEQADYALTELSHNLPLKAPDCSNKSVEASQESKRSAKKPASNKENDSQFDLKKVKNITYTALSKTLEQKNHLIEQQRYEIEALKKCMEEARGSRESRVSEDSRVRSEELAKLKLKEKDYLDNLKEIKLLKGNLQQIRKRYEQMLQEKNTIVAKYNTLLGQHEQLTLLNAHLKLQKQSFDKNTARFQLEQQLSSLQQQLRKQTLQKESIQSRSINFQKRLSEYIVKFNESQEQYNTCQIKYYKLQKECDNFRVDKEDLQQKYANMQRQCIGEREVHQEEVGKLRTKLKRLGDIVGEQEKCILGLKQFEYRTSQEGEEIEKINQLLKKTREENIKLQEESQSDAKRWESYIKELTKEYSQDKEHLCQEINYFKTLYQQQSAKVFKAQTSVAEANSSLFQSQKAQEQCSQELQRYKSKCEDLMNENQRIFNHYNSQLFEKDEEIKRSRGLLSYLQIELQQKNRNQEQIAERINLLQAKITEGHELVHENIALQQNISHLNTFIEELKQQHQRQIAQKNQQLAVINERQSLLEHRNTSIDAQLQRIKEIQEQYHSEKRYYQQKYEQQLQEYNSLSKYFHATENQNSNLLKTNTANIIQISNLKGEIAQLQADLQKTVSTNDKASNSNMCAQIASITQQLVTLKQQISILIEQSSESQTTIDSLQAQNSHLSQQLSFAQANYLRNLTQKEQIILKVKRELQLQVEEVRTLNTSISIIQGKYRSLSQQYQRQLAQWQQQRSYLQQQWARLNQSNDQQLRQLYNSRTTAEYQLDNSHSTIAILKRENSELHKIFTEQIERRNGIIRELIKEKKSLYGQLMTNSEV